MSDREVRQREVAMDVVADLCAIAEEQPGNPHDNLSERLYAIAEKLENAYRMVMGRDVR